MSTAWSDDEARTLLRRIFDAAVASADPGPAVLRHLPEKPRGRCIVVGAGKASAAMAAALDAAWPDVELTGVVVTRYGHAVPAGRIRIVEASHPVPDAMSETAAQLILAAVVELSARRSGDRPDLGRRVGTHDAAGRRHDACRQAGGQSGPAGKRRDDHGDERGSQAPLGYQGGTACRGDPTRPPRDPGHQRRAGRRSRQPSPRARRSRMPVRSRTCGRSSLDMESSCPRLPGPFSRAVPRRRSR